MTNRAANRPRRQRKGDRITQSGSSKAEIECDHAIAPFHRLAETMDRKWGIDRLPELVSVETAAKYGSAVAKLNDALDRDDPEGCKLRAQVCMRGLVAMDREAIEAGMPEASEEYWEYEVDGFRFGVMRDSRNWQVHHAARPDLQFFTLREIGVALKALRIDSPIFAEVKKNFPTAEITRIAERGEKTLEDEIPF